MKKLTFFLILTLAIGCSKEDDEQNIGPSYEPQFLREIIKDGQTISRWNYQNSKILSIQFFDSSGVSATSSFSYVADTTIRNDYNANNELYYQRKYFEVSTSVVRRDNYQIFSGVYLYDGYRTYEFEDSQCWYTRQSVYANLYQLEYTYTYTFTDQNCSETMQYENATSGSTGQIERLRDGKNNILKHGYLDIIRYGNVGNTLAYTYYDYGGEIVESSSYENSFVYDANNYPIKETRTYLNGTQVVYEFVYD